VIDRELMDALVLASAQLQEANRKCRAAGREDLCAHLRNAAWDIAAAIADVVPDSQEVAS